MSNLKGRCLCGDVRFRVNQDPILISACYCKACHKIGSGVTNSVVVLAEAFKLQSGNFREWEYQTDSGATKTMHACARCNFRVFNISTDNPHIYRVAAGCMDDVVDLVPQIHLWTSRKLPWLTIPGNAAQFETEPEDPNDMFAAVIAAGNAERQPEHP